MDSPEESTELIRLQLQYPFSSNVYPNISNSYSPDLIRRPGVLKSTINDYRFKINELERDSKRSRIEFENDLDLKRKQHKRCRDENEHLQREATNAESSLAKLKVEKEELDERFGTVVKDYEVRLVRMGKERRMMEEQRDELRDSKEKIEMEKTEEIWRLQKELDNSRLEQEQAQLTYQHESSHAEKLRSQVKSLESQLCDVTELKAQVKEHEKFRDQYEEDAIMVKYLKSQYKNFPEVQKEYVVLKKRQENLLLLNEKYEDMKDKYERGKERLSDMDGLMIENEELQRQLSKWTAMKSLVSEKARSVEDLLHQIATLQNAEAVLLENQAKLQARVKILDDVMQTKNAENLDIRKKFSAEKSQNVLLEDKMRRLDRKMSLVKGERDHYREIIDTYERDCTVNLPTALAVRDEQQHAKVMRELEDQCRELEGQIEMKDARLQGALNTIQQLEARQRQQSDSLSTSVVSETDKQVIAQLRGQVSQLEKTLESVSEEKFQVESVLERFHLQGAYDPRTTKVLQLGDNPASVALRERGGEVERLRLENTRLQERVTMLEESEGRVQDLTAQVECNVLQQTTCTKQLDEIKEKMESAELTNTRLMEVFKKTSNDLRTACYCLTGWQINVLSVANFRVTHMFAGSPDDYLLFRLDTHGNLQLLESPYSHTLTELMDLYLNQHHSLPAFTSALALDLFKQQSNT